MLSPLRPATAAIAAALAFPATPLAAQVPAPVIDVAPAAPPQAAPPSAPAPTIVIAPAPPPSPPAEAVRSPAVEAPARAAAPAARAERRAAADAPRARDSAAPASATEYARAAAPVGVSGTPVAASAPAPLPAADMAEAGLGEASPVPGSDEVANETVALALTGAAAAAIGIGGLAFAARRRRRKAMRDGQDTADEGRGEPVARDRAVRQLPLPPRVQPLAFAAPQPRSNPHARTGAGRHEALVDHGPTPDNPFLTRRNRLRRARFLDRLEANGWFTPHGQRQVAGAR